MSVIQIGLIDTTGLLNHEFVSASAAALNLQVMRDLPQCWEIHATVHHLVDPRKIPPSVWPLLLVPELPDGMGGVHLDRNNQPYAMVRAPADTGGWTIAASHEIIEMLIDPWGNRLQAAPAVGIAGRRIVDAPGEFGYLVEGCDPCEADRFGYAIHGIAVSDFITPHYYDARPTIATRYSFAGHVPAPRQVLPGGYIAYVDYRTAEWQRIDLFGRKPRLTRLGRFTGNNVREWIDDRCRRPAGPR